MNELYKLLNDCHTALAKTALDDKQYNELSERLIKMKFSLLNNGVYFGGDIEAPKEIKIKINKKK